jgi:putative ABC transport system permease protein
VSNIFILLSKDFLKLVIIANTIAVPVVWLVMEQWLSGFAFRMEIGVWIFFLAGVISVLVALLTVSYQSVTAATTDPVKSLRYE